MKYGDKEINKDDRVILHLNLGEHSRNKMRKLQGKSAIVLNVVDNSMGEFTYPVVIKTMIEGRPLVTSVHPDEITVLRENGNCSLGQTWLDEKYDE